MLNIKRDSNLVVLQIKNQYQCKNDRLRNYIVINIGTDKDPKLIKIGKGTSKKERNNLINLSKEYRDVLAFSYDELKAYREDMFQHTIPLKEEAKEVKPF